VRQRQPRRDRKSGALLPRRRLSRWWLLGLVPVLAAMAALTAYAVMLYLPLGQIFGQGAASGSQGTRVGNGPTLTGNQRINVLLLGSDTDAKFVVGHFNSQSMIVVSVLPSAHRIDMISIPRDMWLPVPGHGRMKIDQAFYVGGVPLAEETVTANFHIPIDHYAFVGLQGFIKVVDAVGGVDLDVSHPIADMAYPADLDANGNPYSVEHLYIPAGPQHLDGSLALQYVRSRHGDLIGDFGRSQRQQELLTAIKHKLDAEGLALIPELPSVLGDLSTSVRTDILVSDLPAWAAFVRGVQDRDIHRYVLSPPTYSENGISDDGTGQDVVLPHWRAIDSLLTSIFGSQLLPTPTTTPARQP
jgi:LCP family protein required for cell wall assembly